MRQTKEDDKLSSLGSEQSQLFVGDKGACQSLVEV